MSASEPCFDVAHLGHVELLTDKPDESLDFFVNVYGLTETGRDGASVYLRAFDDYELHTLKLTAAATTGLGHVGYRCSSPAALERRVAAIEALRCAGEWTDGDLGHGPAYRFTAPSGHPFEVYYETRRYEAPEGERPALKNIAQRFHGRGVCVRRLDHFNILAPDVEAMREFLPAALGSRISEEILLDNGRYAGSWFTVNNKGYDLACFADPAGASGRLHHITYAVDQRDDILRAADIFLENGVFIENGPHKHGIQGTFFIYVYEPAGNRIEVGNAGARLILDPDWQTITWTETERKRGQAWGLQLSPSFSAHATPPLKEAAE